MNTYFYIAYQNQGLALIEAPPKEIIAEFLEETTTPSGIGKKYFYNETDKFIYAYYAGGQCSPTSKYEYTSEEAEKTLLEMALENSQNQVGNTIMFTPTNDPKLLIADIEDYLEYYDEDNQTLETALKQFIDKLALKS